MSHSVGGGATTGSAGAGAPAAGDVMDRVAGAGAGALPPDGPMEREADRGSGVSMAGGAVSMLRRE